MSWSPEDDVDEFGRTPREQRAATRCQCGYPDWPGSCPGPAACPCCQSDDGDDAALFANPGRHTASDAALIEDTLLAEMAEFEDADDDAFDVADWEG